MPNYIRVRLNTIFTKTSYKTKLLHRNKKIRESEISTCIVLCNDIMHKKHIKPKIPKVFGKIRRY